jgi:AcrR family transcriptional regulator
MAKPREKRQQVTKELILDTARRLITKQGVEHFSLRELARAVDYSPAALYEYFDSKEDILAALCRQADIRLSRQLQTVPTNLAAAERLVALGLAYVDFARQNREHYLLMFSHLTSDRPSLAEPVDEASPYHILLQTVATGITAGIFPSREGYGVEQIAYACWALVHGMAMLQLIYLQEFKADFEAADRRALETFVRGLRAG